MYVPVLRITLVGKLWVVRIIAVTALILATKVTFVAYIVAWVVLDKEPKAKKSKSTYGKAGFDEDEQTIREETRIERTSDGRTIEVKNPRVGSRKSTAFSDG